MSSPIAKTKKRIIDKILIKFHKKISHNNRVNILSKLFINEIELLSIQKENINILDIGCGDMSILKNIKIGNKLLNCTGIDIYPNTLKWENYIEYDGLTFPFKDNTFDIAIFSDVLHHDFKNIEILMKEAKRTSNYIIIKDHFEYGFFSRKILQLSDIIGNYGYGVSIPKNYFTIKSFYTLLEKCNLYEIKHNNSIQLYNHNIIIRLIFKSKYQFISILK